MQTRFLTFVLVAFAFAMTTTKTVFAQQQIFTNPSDSIGWVKIETPKGGEAFDVGSTITIKWENSPNIDAVQIMYLFGPSLGNWVVAPPVPNTGSFDWKINVGNHVFPAKIKLVIFAYETNKGCVYGETDYFMVNKKE